MKLSACSWNAFFKANKQAVNLSFRAATNLRLSWTYKINCIWITPCSSDPKESQSYCVVSETCKGYSCLWSYLSNIFPIIYISTVLFSLPATNRIVPKIPNIGLVTAEGGTSFLTKKKTNKKHLYVNFRTCCECIKTKLSKLLGQIEFCLHWKECNNILKPERGTGREGGGQGGDAAAL